MSYVKQNFADGQTLTAAQLNHMEDGIAAAADDKGDAGDGISETAKALLLSLLENAAYTSPSMQAQLNALRTEWSSSSGGGSDEIPVQSVSLSSSALTLNEGESKTLTATVLPADATNKSVIWTVTPVGVATVVNGTVTASKAGGCTVTAMAGGKSASCSVTVKAAAAEAEATLLYTLSSATTTSSADKTCLDTGLQLLAKASTESPQYTILWEAQVADNADASTWPNMVNCQTETGSFTNMPGFNGNLNPNTGTLDFAYYKYSFDDARLCDTLEHAKTKTRYAVQLNGAQFRVGSTHCTLSGWKKTGDTVKDVPETLIFGASYTATGEHTRFLDCTISQCMVYKGLLSDEKVNEFINSSGSGSDSGSDKTPVQSISLSSSALTLNEGESKTLTVTVLPANATYGELVLNFSPGSLVSNSGVPVKLSQNVYRYTLKALKAGNCTVTATAGGKSASCTVTVEAAETAQLIYTLPAETELTNGFDTGLKLLEHASTESPQYTILVDAKAGDNFDASTWPAFLHCLTETGSTANLPGFNSTSSPLNNKTEFAYYNYGGVTLSDSIEHLKTRTRYVVQLDGKKYRGGSTYCPMTEWLTSNGTITDVPQTFLIGAAQSADGSKKQQFWPGTLYQCKVYKGLLSDEKVNEFINSSGSDSGSDKIPVQSVSLSQSTLTLKMGDSATLTATVTPADATNREVSWSVSPIGIASVRKGTVTAKKAGSCTVTATAGGKWAQCAVTVVEAETAQLIYTLPAETELTNGFDTGLKLLEHASTESPQYTILVDAKAGDNFDASTWPAFLHCLTETGSTANLPGFNSTSSPLNNKTEFAYYNYGGVTLSDSIEHLKTRTRYVVQLDGKKYRGGSTYCQMTEWKTSNGAITDVPQTFLIGAAQSADGSKKQQFWPGTLYKCEVYKGLLSDEKVNEYIKKGW